LAGRIVVVDNAGYVLADLREGVRVPELARLSVGVIRLVGLIFAVYWVYSGFDRSPEIQKDGAAIYGERNCSVARSGPRDGGRWRNVPRLY
jgi:hypothetical protein